MSVTRGEGIACASELSALTSSVDTVRFSFSACRKQDAIQKYKNGAFSSTCQIRKVRLAECDLPNKEGANCQIRKARLAK